MECSWSGERGEIVCSDEIVNTAGEKSPTGGGMSGEYVMSGEI